LAKCNILSYGRENDDGPGLGYAGQRKASTLITEQSEPGL